jgi:type VI protein secretion system component VasF
MNDPIPSPSSPDLAQQVTALQRQVFLLLVCLIVVTATVVFYLGCQSVIQSRDFDAARPADMLMIQQYGKNALEIENFEKQLVSYGATHPTFEPVLAKWGLVQGSTGPTAMPAQ